MKLNDFGEIVKEEWFKTAIIRPNVELIEDEFVVMPNHIHGIIWINDDICRGTAHNGRGTAHNGRGTAHNGRGTLQRAPTETIEQFGKPVPNSIPTIIRLLKSTTTKQINLLRQTPGEPVWQRNYYEHVINSDKDCANIADYIYDNPANWEKDDENQLG